MNSNSSKPTKDGNRQQGRAGQTPRPKKNNDKQIQGRRKQNIKTKNQQTRDNKNPKNSRDATVRKDTNRKTLLRQIENGQ